MKKAFCLIMVLAVAFALCACGHTPTTCDNFISVMESKGFTVEPIPDTPEGSKGYMAYNDDDSFVVLFYEMDSVDQAYYAYKNAVANLDAMSGSSSSVSAGNSSWTGKTSGGDYYLASYVENTYMFGVATEDQADALKDLFTSFDYK